MRKSNVFLTGSLATALVLAVSGCGTGASQGGAQTNSTSKASNNATSSTGNNSTSSSATGVTINVLADQSKDIDYLKTLLPEFTKKTGIKVNITPVAYADIESKALLDLSSHSNQYDVMEVYTEMFPTVSAGNWLDSVSYLKSKYPNVTPIDTSKYLANYIKYYSSKGKVLSIPFQPDTRLLWYNADWLKSNHLSPPQTWAELEADAKKATKSDGSQFGFEASTSEQGWIALTWLPVVYSTGTGIFNSKNMPILTSPKIEKATKFYVNMVRSYGPSSARNIVGQKVEADMQHKQVIFGDADTVYTANGYQNEPFPVSQSGTTRYGSAEIGGWSFSVVHGPKEKAAYKFLQWATSPSVELKVALNARHTSGVTSVWKNAQFQQKNPYWKGELAALSSAKAFAPYSIEPKIDDILNQYLSKMVAGTVSVSAGLQDAQNKIATLMKQDGIAK